MCSRKADNLLLFKSIVDSGSLSTAAKLSNISISQASKRMTHLEATLGIKLLHRSTRKLTLTPPGEILYNKLQAVKQQIDESWQLMLEYGNAPRGSMRVAAPHYYGLNYLMHRIKQFNQRHQQINVDLQFIENEQEQTESSFDIAFRSHRIAHGQMIPDSNLTAKKVLSEALVFVANPTYLNEYGTPICPEELSKHKCLSTNTDNKKRWLFYRNNLVNEQPIESSFEANDFEAVHKAALAGMGIAMIPRRLLEKNSANKLVLLFNDYTTETLDTYAYYNANQLACKKVNLFLQEFTREAEQQPELYTEAV